ncbi:MAG: FAD:protein FMN transferase [Nocardioides sp.]
MMGPDALASHDWQLWSTTGRLVVTRPETLPAAIRLVDDHLAAIERAASRFRPDAEIMTLTPGPDGSVSLSPTLAELLRIALDAARRTDGALDPTVGGTVSDLGYDKDIALVVAEARPGSFTGVARVRRVPGWRTVHLDGDRLTLTRPDVLLDLGATAKAAAADQAAAIVADRLGTGVLVSLGGDIATAGPAPAGGWQSTVQDTPDDPATQVGLPAGGAIATSSTARRRWLQAGEEHHHLSTPRRHGPRPRRSAASLSPPAPASRPTPPRPPPWSRSGMVRRGWPRPGWRLSG